MTKLTQAAAMVAALTIGLVGQAQAAQKIGVVDVQAIFQQLPQAAQIENTIRVEYKDKIEAINRMEKEIKYLLEKQQRESTTMSASQKDELTKKVMGLREQYAGQAKPLDNEIKQRMGEERNKLLSLIKQSIDEVAKKNNYDLILQNGAVAFVDQSADISEKVLTLVSKTK